MPFVLEIVNLDKLPPADEILADEEKAVFNSFKFEKRKKDWLGGRFAAKTAVLKYHPAISCRDAVIKNDANRKPSLFIKDIPSAIPISISHCAGFAAAAAGGADIKAIGVDVEKIETRPGSWIEEAFHPGERLQSGNRFFTALWTKKEALLKALGIGLNADLWDIRFTNDRPEFSGTALAAWQKAGQPRLRIITCEKPSGCMLSVAIGESNG